MKTGYVKSSTIPINSFRIDPSLHLSEGIKVRTVLNQLSLELTTLSKCTEKIFLGSIFARSFVKNKDFGITYLAASDTVLANIETGRYLSKKQAEKLNYLKLEKDWILVTCSGTLGNITYTNKTFSDKIATHDLIRIIPNDEKMKKGCLYAFLLSKYGHYQITQSRFGGVVKHINDKQAGEILIPLFSKDFQNRIEELIQESVILREEATADLKKAESLLKSGLELDDLTTEDYEYYGPHSSNRKVACFRRNIKDIGVTTINAFNHSERVRNRILSKLYQKEHILFKDCLNEDKLYSSTGVEVVELEEGHGIQLLNQSDIFDTIVKGKWVRNNKKYSKHLLKYGEILIAKIGTLSESESFCRCLFVGEELEGQLISSAFYRLRTNDRIPAGYLYTWLSSDYGFRLIRFTQYGTKLCYPNPKLLYDFPVPVLASDKMQEINELVEIAHKKRYKARLNELLSVSLIEQEIEK